MRRSCRKKRLRRRGRGSQYAPEHGKSFPCWAISLHPLAPITTLCRRSASQLRSRADQAKAPKPAASAGAVAIAVAGPDEGCETIACMHCGHINRLPGGLRPGRTVSCRLCARMFSVEAAAAHVPPPPPSPRPLRPG